MIPSTGIQNLALCSVFTLYFGNFLWHVDKSCLSGWSGFSSNVRKSCVVAKNTSWAHKMRILSHLSVDLIDFELDFVIFKVIFQISLEFSQKALQQSWAVITKCLKIFPRKNLSTFPYRTFADCGQTSAESSDWWHNYVALDSVKECRGEF